MRFRSCENSSKPIDLSRYQSLWSGSPARMAAGEADEIIGNCAFRPVETGLFLCFPKRLLCGWREASGKVRTMSAELKTGAEMLIRALKDQGVDVIFGYPGGAVLPISAARPEEHTSALQPLMRISYAVFCWK